jgi:hypothetical protein
MRMKYWGPIQYFLLCLNDCILSPLPSLPPKHLPLPPFPSFTRCKGVGCSVLLKKNLTYQECSLFCSIEEEELVWRFEQRTFCYNEFVLSEQLQNVLCSNPHTNSWHAPETYQAWKMLNAKQPALDQKSR